MKKTKIKQGDVFNRLTIDCEIFGKSRRWFRCICKCGNTHEASLSNLQQGKVTSCGCARGHNLKTHGAYKRPAYQTWKGIIQRTNPLVKASNERYSDRGISVCPEWKDFYVFEKWALENGWKKGLTIEREHNDLDYCPENCKVDLPKVQGKNKSTSRWWVVNGVCYSTAREAAESLGTYISDIQQMCGRGPKRKDGSRRPAKAGCYSVMKYKDGEKIKEPLT